MELSELKITMETVDSYVVRVTFCDGSATVEFTLNLNLEISSIENIDFGDSSFCEEDELVEKAKKSFAQNLELVHEVAQKAILKAREKLENKEFALPIGACDPFVHIDFKYANGELVDVTDE